MSSAIRLRSDASKCRDLASTAVTSEARKVLAGMAADYEQAACAIEARPKSASRRPAFKWPLS